MDISIKKYKMDQIVSTLKLLRSKTKAQTFRKEFLFNIAKTEKKMTPEGKVQITKRLINNKTKEKFKNALQEMTWDDVISSKQTDSAYEAFLNKFTSLYDKIFEKFPVTVKSKTLKNPWITKGIL